MRAVATVLLLIALASRNSDAQTTDTSFSAYWARFGHVADSLTGLNPQTELQRALARGDRRFLGLQGFAIAVPGVKRTDPLYPRQSEVRVIPGTSDGLRGPRGARLNRVAAAYAARYNRALLAELHRQP